MRVTVVGRRPAARPAIAAPLSRSSRRPPTTPEGCRDAGAACIAQDEATSVVWGMPGAAYEVGAAETLHPLHAIAGKIMQLVGERNGAYAA